MKEIEMLVEEGDKMKIDLNTCKPGDKLRIYLSDEHRKMGITDIVTYVASHKTSDPDVIEIIKDEKPLTMYGIFNTHENVMYQVIYDNKEDAIAIAKEAVGAFAHPDECIVYELKPAAVAKKVSKVEVNEL